MSLLSFRHKIISIWQHGLCMYGDEICFWTLTKSQNCGIYLQVTYHHYTDKATVKSVVQRVQRWGSAFGSLPVSPRWKPYKSQKKKPTDCIIVWRTSQWRRHNYIKSCKKTCRTWFSNKQANDTKYCERSLFLLAQVIYRHPHARKEMFLSGTDP